MRGHVDSRVDHTPNLHLSLITAHSTCARMQRTLATALPSCSSCPLVPSATEASLLLHRKPTVDYQRRR